MESLADRLILLWGWRRLLVALLAGALAALSQPPYDFFAVCFLSFPVLVWLIDGSAASGRTGLIGRLWSAFAPGWWFGLGYFVAGLWWTGAALLVEAEQFAWALPFAILGLPAVLAVFYGLAAALARIFWSDGIGRIFALAAAFGLCEWLRSIALTGFPWNAIGYAAMPVPLLMQSAAITGLFGMSALAVLVFAMPALLATGRQRRAGAVVAIVLIAAHVGYGYLRLAVPEPGEAETLAVRLVQPSISQDRKWDVERRDDVFATYLELSAAPPAEGSEAPELILWPETAVPFLFTDRPDALAALAQLLGDGQLLLAGAVRGEGGSGSPVRYYNSVVAIDGSGAIYDAVDKMHLVPFGEYVPFEDLLGRLGIRRIVQSIGGFSAGTERHAIVSPSGARLLPFVCYEVIFPGLVARGAASADVLVNVTNDAWYGDTPGPHQHFRQAQLRAVETGLPMLRAANNGISAIVDSRGRIVDALALNAYGVLDASIATGGFTAYAFGMPFVNGMVIIGLFVAIALLINGYMRLRAN